MCARSASLRFADPTLAAFVAVAIGSSHARADAPDPRRPVFNAPEQFADFLKADRANAERMVKESGLQPQ